MGWDIREPLEKSCAAIPLLFTHRPNIGDDIGLWGGASITCPNNNRP
jgi:hypothetical protein